LGTGIVSTALKGGMAKEEAVRKIVGSMAALNQRASETMRAFGAHACTDITGFGLIGHAQEMAKGSRVGMVVRAGEVPLFPEALDFAKIGLIPGGAYSNRQFFSCCVDLEPDVPSLLVDLLYDPQTSGGLLISVPSEKAEGLVAALREKGERASAIVGEVVEGPSGRLRIV
jgi:selenide,water dikinase